MKNIIVLIMSVFLVGCENDGNFGIMEPHTDIDDRVLDVFCSNCTTDESGNLYYPYTGYNYGTINFTIENVDTYTIVAWTSPHEYCVEWHNDLLCEPVINYQVYSDEEGNGNQNFYMNDTFIGETLRLIGFINQEVYDEIYVTIYDGR